MTGLDQYLEKIYNNCRIPFKAYVDGKVVFEADPVYFQSDVVEDDFLLGSSECKLIAPILFKESIELLKFCIKDKFCEYSTDSEKIILDLLNGADISEEKIRDNTKPLKEDSFLVVISVKDKIDEAVEILRDIYSDTEVKILDYKDYVLLLGSFENIQEHTCSIHETLYTSIYKKCHMCYIEADDYVSLKEKFELCRNKLNVAEKYNVSGRVFNKDSLMFESIIDNLNENEKNRIINKFNDGFEKLDNDIIQSIDVFFEFNLNLSEAAKKLYVHRNTLIYRLDKIQKYTSYDIRKFNDAVIFKIAFAIWKQKRNIWILKYS